MMLYFKNYRKTIFLLMSILAFSTSYARAEIGYNVSIGARPALCRIDVFEPPFIKIDSRHVSHTALTCSGVLISPTQILTAGHCVIPLLNKENTLGSVACGSVTKGKESTFTETETPISVYLSSNYNPSIEAIGDVALINLSNASKITPIPFGGIDQAVKTIQEVQANKDDSNFGCLSAGIGEDSAGITGTANTSDMTQNINEADSKGYVQANFSAVEDVPQKVEDDLTSGQEAADQSPSKRQELIRKTIVKTLMALNKIIDVNASLMPGDSGGPLFCHTSDSPQWNLVGVASDVKLLPASADDKPAIYDEMKWTIPDLSLLTQKIWEANLDSKKKN